jgi:hypothetical protein
MRAALADEHFLRPDIWFLLRLPTDKQEIGRRRATRVEFEESDIVYDATGYLSFVRDLSQELRFSAPIELEYESPTELAEIIIRHLGASVRNRSSPSSQAPGM